MKTIPIITAGTLQEAWLASKKNNTVRATLIHERNGVQTICHGFLTEGIMIKLIAGDMSRVIIEAGDTVSYDDGL